MNFALTVKKQKILTNKKWFQLAIINARQIDFAGYQLRTEGMFANHHSAFANLPLVRMQF